MVLINFKIHLKLNCNKNCVMSDNNNNATFRIKKDIKIYVPIVTLSTDNVKLTKQLSKGFKRSVYWTQYKV